MQKKIFFLLLLWSGVAFSKVEDNPYYLPQDVCKNTSDCSEEIAELATYYWNLRGTENNEVTRIYYSGVKTPYVFVFIHGTFEDSRLFAYNTKNVFSKKQNAIDLVLPGHGADFKSGYDLEFNQWFLEAKKLLHLSLLMGEKIVFVTHSLGALIAIDLAIEYPQYVDSLVLVEPALSPSIFLTQGACGAKYIIEDGRMFLPFIKYVGINTYDRPIPLNVGCEVGKVPHYLIKKYLGEDLKFEDPKSFKMASEKIVSLAQLIKNRVLLINNLRDRVVDPDVNEDFFKLLNQKGRSQYIPLKLNSYKHGYYLHTQNYDFQQLMLKYLDLRF